MFWCAAALAFGHFALIAYADFVAPQVYDPEYAARLARLRARKAEHPDRPLLVMLGSSRTCQLFRPEQMPPLVTSEGREVLSFNFSRSGGGPVYSRFAFRRLHRQDLTPDWVVVEMMSAFFTQDFERYFYAAVTADELGDLGEYISRRRAIGFYAKYRYAPWRSNRTGLVREFAPSWSTPFHGVVDPNGIDSHGGEGRLSPTISDAVREAADTRAAAGYARTMANFRIHPGADRAFRDLLRECREAGTKVVIVRTPESNAFRAASSADALAVLAAYRTELSREFGAPFIDASEWLPDSQFADGHHPLLTGQATFTARLHGEVLLPLVAGRLNSLPATASAAK